MKKCAILFLVELLLTSFSTGSALDLKGKIAVSGNGGMGFPVGDFADDKKGAAKSGLAFGGSLEYFITDNISIGGNFTYRKYNADMYDVGEEFAAALEAEFQEHFPGVRVSASASGDHKITTFGGFGKYLVTASPQISPYLKFGLGKGVLNTSLNVSSSVSYAGHTINFTDSIDAECDNRTYLDMGGGVLYQFSQFIALTGEVLYTHLMTEEAEGDVKEKVTLIYRGRSVEDRATGKGKFKCDTDYLSASVGLSLFLY
jgi:opacity protein-like surface antigen